MKKNKIIEQLNTLIPKCITLVENTNNNPYAYHLYFTNGNEINLFITERALNGMLGLNSFPESHNYDFDTLDFLRNLKDNIQNYDEQTLFYLNKRCKAFLQAFGDPTNLLNIFCPEMTDTSKNLCMMFDNGVVFKINGFKKNDKNDFFVTGVKTNCDCDDPFISNLVAGMVMKVPNGSVDLNDINTTEFTYSINGEDTYVTVFNNYSLDMLREVGVMAIISSEGIIAIDDLVNSGAMLTH